jgi:hypothetical protein
MSATPLSDAIAQVLAHDTPETYARFLDVFMQSSLGVIVTGLPPGASGAVQVKGDGVGCAKGQTPDGRVMLLACADRAVFVTRFDRPFNAEIEAASLMNVVMTNPDCAGIMINSATSEHTIVVERATIARLMGPAGPAPTPSKNKPWWRFW